MSLSQPEVQTIRKSVFSYVVFKVPNKSSAGITRDNEGTIYSERHQAYKKFLGCPTKAIIGAAISVRVRKQAICSLTLALNKSPSWFALPFKVFLCQSTDIIIVNC